MSTLTFADTHNMVAFLEKPAESDGFHEIIDFLNANQIHYALTVNPTIYTSCIEQFWATAKANTVNGERQLQALVDKKRVIITESSIRSDLHLADAGGIDCLPTATIFEELARIGHPLLLNHYPLDLRRSSLGGNKGRKLKFLKMRHIMMTVFLYLPMIHFSVVLDLEMAKDAQAKEIAGLKKRVQKLERKNKSRTTRLRRLQKVGESSRVESSKDKESLSAQEDASKQGRIKIINETQGRLDDAEIFDTDDLHGDEVIVDMAVGVTAAKIDEITSTSAPTTVIDELTLAQTFIEIKAAKPKAVTTAATTTTTRPKDKGKAIMIEPEVPLKRKDEVALDEEMARNLEAQLQAELIEEEKMARKKEEEANIALIESWENTQAIMEADRLLAERLQTREQEELTDEEKAKLFMEFMEKRRKHFAALRA
ncbi:hypothetical protein Tco_0914748 [Tanacetum coccineum]